MDVITMMAATVSYTHLFPPSGSGSENDTIPRPQRSSATTSRMSQLEDVYKRQILPALTSSSSLCAHQPEELVNAGKIIRPAYKYVGHHRP